MSEHRERTINTVSGSDDAALDASAPRTLAKPQRQHRVARLLAEHAVSSQAQLVDLLAAEGVTSTQARVAPASSPRDWRMVSRSASAWQGWPWSDSRLTTGIVAAPANSSSRAWS